MEEIHRQDIFDAFGSKIEGLLPGRAGSWGGKAEDTIQQRGVFGTKARGALARSFVLSDGHARSFYGPHTEILILEYGF